ncbi:MAG TPA: hypothetical protein QF625_00765 [Candidatus Scalindua sp.]|nr:hypothetical protein [Candidatus Scalindua sp.]
MVKDKEKEKEKEKDKREINHGKTRICTEVKGERHEDLRMTNDH